jgi:hypothetical protein
MYFSRMRDLYEYRRRRFVARHSEQTEGDGYEDPLPGIPAFRAGTAGCRACRATRLRSEGRISDEVRRRVERDLDLEDARLEI